MLPQGLLMGILVRATATGPCLGQLAPLVEECAPGTPPQVVAVASAISRTLLVRSASAGTMRRIPVQKPL